MNGFDSQHSQQQQQHHSVTNGGINNSNGIGNNNNNNNNHQNGHGLIPLNTVGKDVEVVHASVLSPKLWEKPIHLDECNIFTGAWQCRIVSTVLTKLCEAWRFARSYYLN